MRIADVGAVCGRRRERIPERSIYNWLCDLEWDRPVGEVRAFGGDVMMRADALEAVGGYRDDLIAGEEPELCVRLRAAGWRIWRLDREMTLHDAAMTRFDQWWRRAVRGAAMHSRKAPICTERRPNAIGSGSRAALGFGGYGCRSPACCPWRYLAMGLGRVADISASDSAPDNAQPWTAGRSRTAGAVPGACPGSLRALARSSSCATGYSAVRRISSNTSDGAMRIAYLVNQYPKVSHIFIRREILALERRGSKSCELRCAAGTPS